MVISWRGSTGKYTYWPDVAADVNLGVQLTAVRVTANISINPGADASALLHPCTIYEPLQETPDLGDVCQDENNQDNAQYCQCAAKPFHRNSSLL